MDKIIRVYTRLEALKVNLPADRDIKEKYIKEYHEIIDILTKEVNISLDEYKISENEIRSLMTSCWPAVPGFNQKGGATYTDDRYCERAFFMSKLDALLSYFKISYLSKEKPKIGFEYKE